MITTKRQIRRDSDRFGGYYGTETEVGGIPLISDYEGITNLEPIAEPISNSSSMLVSDAPQAAPQQQLYTTLETGRAAAPAPAPAAPTYKPLPERPQKQMPHDKEDLLPTVKTRAYAKEQPVENVEKSAKNETTKRPRNSLDARTKIMLCVYVIVALVLAIAVIATGVSISATAAKADDVAKSVAQKQQIIAQQQQEIALLQDADAIRGKAVQNGMVDAGKPAYSVSNVETVGYPEATERTDGWDKFFDLMSSVFN